LFTLSVCCFLATTASATSSVDFVRLKMSPSSDSNLGHLECASRDSLTYLVLKSSTQLAASHQVHTLIAIAADEI
jgi:hypothetical protein